MKTVTVSEAKTHLSRLLERVLDGEVIAIGRRGRPEVVLTRIEREVEPRELGGYEGPFEMAEDFDALLPDDILAAFEG